MNDRDILMRAILDRPDDDAPRVAYASHLEDEGDSDQAAFVVMQLLSAEDEPSGSGEPKAVPTAVPTAAHWDERWKNFGSDGADAAMRWTHEGGAAGFLGKSVGDTWVREADSIRFVSRDAGMGVEFRRGFPETATAQSLADAQRLLVAFPLRRVVVESLGRERASINLRHRDGDDEAWSLQVRPLPGRATPVLLPGRRRDDVVSQAAFRDLLERLPELNPFAGIVAPPR